MDLPGRKNKIDFVSGLEAGGNRNKRDQKRRNGGTDEKKR